jgi:zinc transporter ZupT
MHAFLLSSVAGFSTLIGFLFIFEKNDRVCVISKGLWFASGVMVTISIIDLIPNSLDLIINIYKFIYVVTLVLLGFL